MAQRAGRPHRVLLLNVKYSENLGDGVLVLCLEHGLKELGFAVSSFDLSGRRQFGDGIASRGALLAALQRLPSPIRKWVAGSALKLLAKRKIRPLLRQSLENADAVVIGGGNLLADADLNFPIKLYTALDEAKQAALPVAVFGVGVSAPWSAAGARYFRNGFDRAKLHFAAVRDRRSKTIWDRDLAGVARDADICPDPGVLTSVYWPQPVRLPRRNAVIGFSLTSPLALAYHTDRGHPRDRTESWTVDLIGLLGRRGYRVRLFTNGAREDDAFLQAITRRIEDAGISASAVDIRPRLLSPDDLIATIADCDVLIGHRLHANIVAYSYGIPSVGLAWDQKLAEFMQSVGRGEFVLDPGGASPEDAMARVELALKHRPDPDRLRQIVSDARAAVSRLGASIENAIAAERQVQ